MVSSVSLKVTNFLFCSFSLKNGSKNVSTCIFQNGTFTQVEEFFLPHGGLESTEIQKKMPGFDTHIFFIFRYFSDFRPKCFCSKSTEMKISLGKVGMGVKLYEIFFFYLCSQKFELM